MNQSVPELSALVLSNSPDAFLFNEVLESHGFRVETAANVTAAERLCKTARFDLAVYDHDIPGAMELAGSRRPSSRPRVAVGLLSNPRTTHMGSARLHFIVRRPFTGDLLIKTIQAAYGPIAADRRVSFRHQVDIPVRSCKMLYDNESRSVARVTIVNLSQTGACIQAKEMLPQSSRIELAFMLPKTRFILRIAGILMWSHVSGRGGIRFTQMTETNQWRLEDWLDSRLPISEILTRKSQAASMNPLFTLAPGETIQDCLIPETQPGAHPDCHVCGQAAYRVIIIAGLEKNRRVALCGAHFISASLRFPGLQRFIRGGKMG